MLASARTALSCSAVLVALYSGPAHGAPAGAAPPAGVPAAGAAPRVPAEPAPAGTGPAAGAAAATLAEPVRRAVEALDGFARAQKARVGALVVDLGTGAVLGHASEHEPLNPASNAKILTAAAALDRMGPDYRFTTALHGKIENGVVSPLVLRGNGDPSLEVGEIWELASAIERQGVRRVENVWVDQSYFDDAHVPPGFEQQPDEWAPFRAPVAAVSIERNAVTLNVVAGSPGKPATIWFDPPGFVDVRGSVATRPRGAGQGVLLTLSPTPKALQARVGGFVAEDLPRQRFSKRVDDPRPLPAHVLSHVLRQMGVEVRGDVGVGGQNVRPRLAYVESEPLSVLVRELGKNSDNFYAETLLKALGGHARGAPARSQDGATVVLDYLTSLGKVEPGTRFTNGSGLFDSTRVSASAIVSVLRHGFESPRLFPELTASFAVGGVDGTLRSRFASAAARRAVRAKTGTLDRVVALSGYVLGRAGRPPVAFAFIVDGTARRAEARQHIDRAVDAIVAYLWRA